MIDLIREELMPENPITPIKIAKRHMTNPLKLVLRAATFCVVGAASVAQRFPAIDAAPVDPWQSQKEVNELMQFGTERVDSAELKWRMLLLVRQPNAGTWFFAVCEGRLTNSHDGIVLGRVTEESDRVKAPHEVLRMETAFHPLSREQLHDAWRRSVLLAGNSRYSFTRADSDQLLDAATVLLCAESPFPGTLFLWCRPSAYSPSGRDLLGILSGATRNSLKYVLPALASAEEGLFPAGIDERLREQWLDFFSSRIGSELNGQSLASALGAMFEKEGMGFVVQPTNTLAPSKYKMESTKGRTVGDVLGSICRDSGAEIKLGADGKRLIFTFRE